MQSPDKSNPSPKTRRQRREQAAADALRSLIHETLHEHFPEHAESRDFDLDLNLHVNRDGTVAFQPGLREQLDKQLEAALLPHVVFQPGTVLDFHQRENRRPPGAGMVFSGYDPFGHPEWSAVTEVIAPSRQTHFSSGKELKKNLLNAYGKDDKHFNLLGQVAVGPLPVPAPYRKLTGAAEWALTCQIVESRDLQSHFCLHLNLLAGGLYPDELEELLQEPPLRPLCAALRELNEQVHRLEASALHVWQHQDNRALSSVLKQVPALLNRFENNLYPPT